MRQVFQNLKDGTTELADLPVPDAAAGKMVIQTNASLVSAGTERMLVEFGKGNWLQKAQQQPDKVREVIEKVRTDGLASTWNAVQSKLNQPLPLGYSNVGRVREVGAGVVGFSVGDRIASNGPHAEMVAVPENLCARVPDEVSDEEASFTVVGAIGLQGIRLVEPTIGECVVVTGLGLIGLLTVQMLRAHGCRVLGIDPDPERLELAKGFGAEVLNPGVEEDVVTGAEAFSRGRGVDAVLITASTRSSEPVSQAAKMCRKRGRIVLVGVTGLELSRADFYEKELSFQVSCSYGPGRYDPDYEERGQDYPVGFVRWTEQRNFEAVLDLMASGALDVQPLISHRYSIDDAANAYEVLASGESSLGILLDYSATEFGDGELRRTVPVQTSDQVSQSRSESRTPGRAGRVVFLGAGNYAGRVLIPAFRASGAELQTLVSSGGLSSVHYGKKFGFREASTDSAGAIDDDNVDTVVIATRHDAHAEQVLAALRAGKHVFCEKPLCLTRDELSDIESEARARPAQRLMVGFNRRFAPQVVKTKQLLDTLSTPKSFVMTVNAGSIPADHWTQDPAVGGGRIVGEACHFVDLLRHLAGHPIDKAEAVSMAGAETVQGGDDCATLTLRFADGSFGSIHYLANGHKAVPKERLEIFAGGRHLRLNNFRKLHGHGWPGFRSDRAWRQDKGQRACSAAFLASIRDGSPAPIPLDEILEVSAVSIELADQARGHGVE